MEELSHPDHKSHGTPAALEKERMQEEKERMQEEEVEEEEEQQSLERWEEDKYCFSPSVCVDSILQGCISMLLPASTGLAGMAEAWSLTGWSRGGEGPCSSLAEFESDFLFREPVVCLL